MGRGYGGTMNTTEKIHTLIMDFYPKDEDPIIYVHDTDSFILNCDFSEEEFMRLVGMVEDKFNIELNEEEVALVSTVGDLIKVVRNASS